jgi:SAM-dependent methyltransferase
MYDELFDKVPDHPRLTRRADPERAAAINGARLKLLERFLHQPATVAEFGSGDCRFAFELCRRARFVYGLDISDQRGRSDDTPENFELVIYDGYNLPLRENSVDLVLSEQLVEHLHPEDVSLHFQMARDILKGGGVYVLHTPHRFTGPHDVSKYFCDEPAGFHLKEWTYAELVSVLRESGYRSWEGFSSFRARPIRVPVACLILVESVLRVLPRFPRRLLARYLLRDIFLAARK